MIHSYNDSVESFAKRKWTLNKDAEDVSDE